MEQEELDKRLKKNGWDWFLFSNLTPGIIRLQMGAEVETLTEWRKCFEAPTLEEAVTKAEEFISQISADEYYRQLNQDSINRATLRAWDL